MTSVENGKHEGLVNVIVGVLKTQGLTAISHVEYDLGELDVRCRSVYYEVKSKYCSKNRNKAKMQIERAIKYGQAGYGYLVCPEGVIDIFKDEIVG